MNFFFFLDKFTAEDILNIDEDMLDKYVNCDNV